MYNSVRTDMLHLNMGEIRYQIIETVQDKIRLRVYRQIVIVLESVLTVSNKRSYEN